MYLSKNILEPTHFQLNLRNTKMLLIQLMLVIALQFVVAPAAVIRNIFSKCSSLHKMLA